MIYGRPSISDALDQGDLIDGCPVVRLRSYQVNQPLSAEYDLDIHRVIVLTQTCDIANGRVSEVVASSVFDAQEMIEKKLLKPADVRGPLRAGRVWGWYFLPANHELGLGEMVVDLRNLHNVRIDICNSLTQNGNRRGRLLTPYREHLAKHFADTYCRIGLPQPFETL